MHVGLENKFITDLLFAMTDINDPFFIKS
jgi:hypothetical protein